MIKENRRGLYSDISLFLVAIIWGGGFVAVKDALGSIGAFQIMTMRFGIATILLSIVFAKRLKMINKKELLSGILIGAFVFGGFAFQTIGLKYTTAGKQAFLTGVYVVLVPFLQWIFIKKKVDIYSCVAAIMALIGIGLLTLQGKFSINVGDSLTLVCALFFAGQIISIDLFTEKHDPIVLTIVQLGFSTILSLIFSIGFGEKAIHLTKSGITSILYLAVLSTMVAFIIQNVAQKYTASTHAAIIMSLESFFGCIFSVMILGERLTSKMTLGCIVIFMAIITAETKWGFLKSKQYKGENV